MKAFHFFLLATMIILCNCTDKVDEEPIVFYPEAISSSEWSENVISFTADENTAFLTRTEGWELQSGYISTVAQGDYTEPIYIPALDSIYNGAISPDGTQILYSVRTDSASSIWLIKKEGDQWVKPINLTKKSALSGGYFYWLNARDIYFYIPADNGNMVKGRLENEQLTITDSLVELNTTSGTEFSPYVDRNEQYMIFSRYDEADENQRGLFISYRLPDSHEKQWSVPEKLDMLPYGWSPYVLHSKQLLLFSDGEDILSYPLSKLALTPTDH